MVIYTLCWKSAGNLMGKLKEQTLFSNLTVWYQKVIFFKKWQIHRMSQMADEQLSFRRTSEDGVPKIKGLECLINSRVVCDRVSGLLHKGKNIINLITGTSRMLMLPMLHIFAGIWSCSRSGIIPWWPAGGVMTKSWTRSHWRFICGARWGGFAPKHLLLLERKTISSRSGCGTLLLTAFSGVLADVKVSSYLMRHSLFSDAILQGSKLL